MVAGQHEVAAVRADDLDVRLQLALKEVRGLLQGGKDMWSGGTWGEACRAKACGTWSRSRQDWEMLGCIGLELGWSKLHRLSFPTRRALPCHPNL